MALNTTPATWVAGSVVTAAQMNTEIRDAFVGAQAAWSAYTPTTTGLTLGNGTIVASFTRIGKSIDCEIIFTFGSTSVLTAQPTFTLPVTAKAANWGVDANIFDTSAAAWFGGHAIATSTTVLGAFTPSTVAAGNYQTVIATRPMTWATGDVLYILARYQAA